MRFISPGIEALAIAAGVLIVSFVARKQRKKSVIDRFWANLGLTQESEESIRHGREFVPREDDIFIATYPKSGTTWVQQICHGLRTGGDMHFDEITCVVPWNIDALDCGQRMSDEHTANPRCFKTHDTYEEVPKGGKYIVVVRDPRDVLVSFHAFLCDWAQTDAKDFPLADFAEVLFIGKGAGAGKYWSHLAGWLEHMNDPNVLFLFFEDLKTRHAQCVRLIADFMKISDPEVIEVATHQSTFEFMRDHARQFDDHFLASNLARRTGYRVTLEVGKVREGGGQVGGYKSVLTPELLSQLDRNWQAMIASRFGYTSYDNLHKRHGLTR